MSYVIACLGSMVALELMKQRTGTRGARNRMLLAGGALALGAIGIWSMHFGQSARAIYAAAISGTRDAASSHSPRPFALLTLRLFPLCVFLFFLISGHDVPKPLRRPRLPRWLSCACSHVVFCGADRAFFHPGVRDCRGGIHHCRRPKQATHVEESARRGRGGTRGGHHALHWSTGIANSAACE